MPMMVCFWMLASALFAGPDVASTDGSATICQGAPCCANGSAVDSDQEDHAMVTNDPLPRPVSPEQKTLLDAHGWDARVGVSVGVWVSVDEQRLRVIKKDTIIYDVPCATAAKGTGFTMNSMKTPLGWHSVKTKVGDDAPWGQVFRGAAPTKEMWKPGDNTDEDLVLTRLLWLTGEEPGVNQGGNVDSYNRYIYIHGTNDEARVGTPSSHGCVRLRNDDVIVAYNLIPKGTRVLITEAKPTEK